MGIVYGWFDVVYCFFVHQGFWCSGRGEMNGDVVLLTDEKRCVRCPKCGGYSYARNDFPGVYFCNQCEYAHDVVIEFRVKRVRRY